MSWNKFVRSVLKVNRVIKDVKAISSGDPKRIIKRERNKILGRMFFRFLRKF